MNIRKLCLALVLCLPTLAFAGSLSFCDEIMDMRTDVRFGHNSQVDVSFFWGEDSILETTGKIESKYQLDLDQITREGAIDGHQVVVKTINGNTLNLWILEFKDNLQKTYFKVYTNYFMPSAEGELGTLMGSTLECK